MNFRLTGEQESFRRSVVEFIERNWTAREEVAGWADESAESDEQSQAFERALIQRRYHVMAWPEEYGGLGKDIISQMIFNEEMAYHRAPSGGTWCGTHLVGPTLMHFGTPEQLRTYLPGISDGSVRWAQCFSEPDAGSDLASLQLVAQHDGDGYVLNGQKIWTSSGHHADWAIVLGRTNPDAPKHRGISFFLVDLRSPGVTVRPLQALDGGTPFSEVFFEDVRVPRDQLVGEENRGWYVATATLDFERSNIGRIASCRRDVADLARLVRDRNDATLPHRLTVVDLSVGAEVGRYLSYRVGFLQQEGLIPNMEASMAKVFGSELSQRIANAASHILGLSFQAESGPRINLWARRYLQRVADTIAAGTSEIQRSIIAQRGLGLPR